MNGWNDAAVLDKNERDFSGRPANFSVSAETSNPAGERDKATFERLHLLLFHPLLPDTTRKKNRLTARQKRHVYVLRMLCNCRPVLASTDSGLLQTSNWACPAVLGAFHKLSVDYFSWNSVGQLETFFPNRYSFVNQAGMTTVHWRRSIFTTSDGALICLGGARLEIDLVENWWSNRSGGKQAVL